MASQGDSSTINGSSHDTAATEPAQSSADITSVSPSEVKPPEPTKVANPYDDPYYDPDDPFYKPPRKVAYEEKVTWNHAKNAFVAAKVVSAFVDSGQKAKLKRLVQQNKAAIKDAAKQKEAKGKDGNSAKPLSPGGEKSADTGAAKQAPVNAPPETPLATAKQIVSNVSPSKPKPQPVGSTTTANSKSPDAKASKPTTPSKPPPSSSSKTSLTSAPAAAGTAVASKTPSSRSKADPTSAATSATSPHRPITSPDSPVTKRDLLRTSKATNNNNSNNNINNNNKPSTPTAAGGGRAVVASNTSGTTGRSSSSCRGTGLSGKTQQQQQQQEPHSSPSKANRSASSSSRPTTAPAAPINNTANSNTNSNTNTNTSSSSNTGGKLRAGLSAIKSEAEEVEELLKLTKQKLVDTIKQADQSELTRMKKLERVQPSGEREMLLRRMAKERAVDQSRIETMSQEYFTMKDQIERGEFRFRPGTSTTTTTSGMDSPSRSSNMVRTSSSFNPNGPQKNRWVGLETHNEVIFFGDVVQKFEKHDEEFRVNNEKVVYDPLKERQQLKLLSERRDYLKKYYIMSIAENGGVEPTVPPSSRDSGIFTNKANHPNPSVRGDSHGYSKSNNNNNNNNNNREMRDSKSNGTSNKELHRARSSAGTRDNEIGGSRGESGRVNARPQTSEGRISTSRSAATATGGGSSRPSSRANKNNNSNNSGQKSSNKSALNTAFDNCSEIPMDQRAKVTHYTEHGHKGGNQRTVPSLSLPHAVMKNI